MPELIELPVPGKWKTALKDSDLANELLLPNYKKERRPAALHAYGTGSSRRWLVSWVKNSGANFRDWSWTQGMSPTDLGHEVDGAHERLRLYLIEKIPDADQFAAAWLIRDLSSNAPWLTWNWTPEIAAQDLKAAVPAGHRLTCVRALVTGAAKVAAIWTQDDSGVPWDWSPSLTFDELHDILRDTKSRLVSLDNHGSGPDLRFCAAWVDNAGPGAEGRTWFWFAGADEAYLRGQANGLCSHPVELCNLGDGALATILNRVPGKGVSADDTLLEVTGLETLNAYTNDAASNTQMSQNGNLSVQVSNVAGADVQIVGGALRWASLGGQVDGLVPSPPSPVGGATTIVSGGTASAAMPVMPGLEYRDVFAYIDAKTADGRRQRLIRSLPALRLGFDPHFAPQIGEPVGLAMWTDTADVIPMWRGGKETRWVNVAGTIVNLTGDELLIVRMDAEAIVDGEWRLEKNLFPLRFQQSSLSNEFGCFDSNGNWACPVVEAEPNGTLKLGTKVLSRFVYGFEIEVEPGFEKGFLRVVLHYQRRRKCGAVMRELPMRWDEPVDVSPPVRGATFWWGNGYDHTDFDAHAWPGPRAAYDITESGEPAEEAPNVYPMADGIVVDRDEPAPTMNDPNPNQSITIWHPELEIWTGYYHLKPGTLLPTEGDSISVNDPIAKIGNSGTKAPHLHTGGHRLGNTGFGRVVPLRFSGLTDDQNNAVTQTPATGAYTS